MEKNGFTLIELIVTIGLLAVLGTMIATNMLGVQSRQMQANYEAYKETIQEAACLVMDSKYVGTGIVYQTLTAPSTLSNPVTDKATCLDRKCYVKTHDLIENGFLDKDLENPATGFSVSQDEIVEIEYKAGIKTCTYIR